MLISHNDKPGIIGRVGTLLGNNDVNIATMQVGRKVVGGAAIMVLTTDKPASEDVMNQLVELPEIMNVHSVSL
jgi:D-3-phosphoglycerate dehydrogenase